MTLPVSVQKVLIAMYEKYGFMNHQGEERRREWTRMVCEQLVYTFGVGSGWGHKASSPTNPPSKDAIAQEQKNGVLYGWDIVAGGSFDLIPEGIFHDITGQYFIRVSPVNHLAGEMPSPTPPAEPVGCQCKDDIGRVATEFARITSILVDQTVAISQLAKNMAQLEAAVKAPRSVTGKVNARFLSGGTIDAEVK